MTLTDVCVIKHLATPIHHFFVALQALGCCVPLNLCITAWLDVVIETQFYHDIQVFMGYSVNAHIFLGPSAYSRVMWPVPLQAISKYSMSGSGHPVSAFYR